MADPRLEVNDGLGRRVIPIDKPTLSIGRRTESDVRLVGSDVSREHAEIIRQDGELVLKDRGSRYGTFVNGEAVTEHRLAHGDRVQFGRTGGAEVVYLTDAARIVGHRPPPARPSATSGRWPRCSKGCGRSARAASSTRCWRWCSTPPSASPAPSAASSCWPATTASSR